MMQTLALVSSRSLGKPGIAADSIQTDVVAPAVVSAVVVPMVHAVSDRVPTALSVVDPRDRNARSDANVSGRRRNDIETSGGGWS